ncbi:hypothetical protein ElyMa_000100400 [Elysia marginata]|uniref:Uncharacterized protein n=1 Tax=Elysia marginata TaxID=1093978 RepID=A0AAV4EKT0_9GAST|nr:hypothetical protein ElyMa_000100400 [Elysia marginata]
MWFIRRILKMSWKDKKTNDEILAGISEIEESVTPASAEEEDGEGNADKKTVSEDLTSGIDYQAQRCRQRRRSSQKDDRSRSSTTNIGLDDAENIDEKAREGILTPGKAENNNRLYHGSDERLNGHASPVNGRHQRIRSTSNSRSPARRQRSSTGSAPFSPTSGSVSGPPSTSSSPRHLPAGGPNSNSQNPRSRKSGYPRRSLSLPNGGLSYGADVKILYRDGHFVAVVDPPAAGSSSATPGGAASSSSTDLGRLETDRDEGSTNVVSSTSSSPRRASTSTTTGAPSPASVLASQILKSGSAASEQVKASMRAEILALLERGITDPKRILEEACLRSLELEPNNSATDFPDLSPASSTNWESAEAPLFHSLPRRKGGKGSGRPVSVDEAQLGKYSKSQQSLVSKAEMERRQMEEGQSGSMRDPGWEDRMMNLAKERSMVKRNKSFNEAMGSRIDMNRVNEEVTLTGVKSKNTDSGSQGKLTTLEDDSKTSEGKSRGFKGPGFIQRMLQKRRGSTQDKPPLLSIGSSALLKASKEDLTGSTVSLPQFASSGNGTNQAVQHTVQTSPGKSSGRERDSSIGRKMSLRSLFKRKNSADLSSTSALSVTVNNGGVVPVGTGDSGSPPIATFLNDDDIGALTNSPPTLSTVVQRRLPQRAENGEPYTLPPDDSDPLSLSYPTRSRQPRGGYQTLPTPGLHAVLGRSVSHEGNSRTEEEIRAVSPRRSRSSSGRGRLQESQQHQLQLQQQLSLSPVSPSSPPSLSLSSPPSTSSSASSRILGHNSWSSSDLDVESSSEDTITSRSISPAGRSCNHFQLSPAATPVADYSFSSVSEADETLVAAQDGLSPPVYRTLTSSPMGARRRLMNRGLSPTKELPCDTTPRQHPLSSPPTSLEEENENEAGLVLDTSREITSSNSNDSGIQRDANVNSSAESITAGVRLRQTSKSPSPSSSASSRRSSAHGGVERPKSDTTVHWADLLEQVMGAVTRGGPIETSAAASSSCSAGAVRRRNDSGRLRRRPRPKSDIGPVTLFPLAKLSADGRACPSALADDQQEDQYDHYLDAESNDDANKDGIPDGQDSLDSGDTDVGQAGSHIPEASVVDHLSVTNSLGNLCTTARSHDNIPGDPTTTTTAAAAASLTNSNITIPAGSYSSLSGGESVSSLVELRPQRGPMLTTQLSASSVLSASSSLSSRDALLPAKLAKFRRIYKTDTATPSALLNRSIPSGQVIIFRLMTNHDQLNFHPYTKSKFGHTGPLAQLAK